MCIISRITKLTSKWSGFWTCKKLSLPPSLIQNGGESQCSKIWEFISFWNGWRHEKLQYIYSLWKLQTLNKLRSQMVKVYKFKAKNEDYFSNKSPLEYKEILSQNFLTMLEDRDQLGRRLFLYKLGKLYSPKACLPQKVLCMF